MNSSLQKDIPSAAIAFRGYNVTNLGRTAELLAVPAYEQIVGEELARFGAICAEYVGHPVDLLRRVREHEEPGLAAYTEAVALVVAVEEAHLRLLAEVHEVDCSAARLSFGFSLGELHAVCGGGAFDIEDLVRVPLALAADCATLAPECTLGVLFSRGPAIPEEAVRQLCARTTAANGGTIGVSAILSPNTYLLVGQGASVERLRKAMPTELPVPAHLRLNDHRWPPLHTPIVRQRQIADRAGVLLEKLPAGPLPPRPEVVSLVTGKRSYAEHSAREILRNWVDHPQRLWDAVCETLAADVTTVLHVGPEPNVIPATFHRLAENLREQRGGRSLESYGLRAMTTLARRPWLATILPARASLLRALFVHQVIAEDWLIEQAPRA